MRFICTEQCELPFMLNLVSDTYEVMMSGAHYGLDIQQEQVAMHLPDGTFAIGASHLLRSQFAAVFDRSHKQALRTVIRHVTTKEMAESDLPHVTDGDVLSDMKSDVIRESPMAYGGRTDDLEKEAHRRLWVMEPDLLAAYRLRSAKLRVAKQLPSPDLFLSGLNALIRLYMQRFNDFFVEEVTFHQLAAQSPLEGIFVHMECDGEFLGNFSDVRKVPPIMRRPWLVHPDAEIDKFKNDLKAGVTPDSVSLLEVRARGFLERGATRSAIIEASAALDLALTRKLRQGFTKQGMSATEIDTILKGEINFKERANRLMHQASGSRVADLDTKLYVLVLGHRDKYRNGIAHADAEPSKQEAEEAIQAFEHLRKLVVGISV